MLCYTFNFVLVASAFWSGKINENCREGYQPFMYQVIIILTAPEISFLVWFKTLYDAARTGTGCAYAVLRLWHPAPTTCKVRGAAGAGRHRGSGAIAAVLAVLHQLFLAHRRHGPVHGRRVFQQRVRPAPAPRRHLQAVRLTWP